MIDNIKKTLLTMADKLCANIDAVQYKHLALGLILVKYNSNTFAPTGAELSVRLSNPADPYSYSDAAPEDIKAELNDCDGYAKVIAFWVTETGQSRMPKGGALLEEACA